MQLWSLLHTECTEMNEARDASRLGCGHDGGGTNGIDALKVGAIVPVACQGHKVHHRIAADHRRVERRAIVHRSNPSFQFAGGGGHTHQKRRRSCIAAYECRHGVSGAKECWEHVTPYETRCTGEKDSRHGTPLFASSASSGHRSTL